MIIETTEKPLDKSALDELILYSGYKVDMVLEYEPDESGGMGRYLIYAKYHQNQVIRQVYTQRDTPRNFKDPQRAIEWGKSIGFRSVCLHVDYEKFPKTETEEK